MTGWRIAARPALIAAMIGIVAVVWLVRPAHRLTGHPALWHVTVRNGGDGWLFGTIHELPDNVMWQTPAIRTAENQSHMLVTEAGRLDPAAIAARFRAMATDGPVAPLARRLPPDLIPVAAADGRAAGLSSAALDRTKSWAIALILSSHASDTLGLSSSASPETVLTADADRAGRPLAGLENAAGQLALFDDLPPADQDALLAATVRQLPAMRGDYQRLLTAWLAADLAALTRAGTGDALATPLIRRRLLTDRNRAWAGRIIALIAAHRRPFVAVGAGHLVGADGVPTLLAARGVTVTRVE